MAPDLTIHKLNDAYVVIECSDGIAYELRDHFTFKVPGHQFMPAFKSKVWDGKIRLFDAGNHTLYKGLVSQVEQFCKSRDYHCVYSYEEFATEMSLNEAEEYITSLEHELDNRDYQINSFAQIVRRKRLLLLSPTGSGKSKVIYDAHRYIENEREKGLIVVPTIQLVEQLYKDFQEYSVKNGYDVEENVHRIYEGKPKNTDKKLTISTWQSIYKMDPTYFHQFDYIIGDEVHTFKSKSLSYIMANLVNADYRIGLTGSLDDTLTHKLVLEGLFGSVYQATTTKTLMDRDILAKLNIKALILKHPDHICQAMSKVKYQEEVNYIVSCAARNTFISKLALSLEGNTLILFQYVKKHGVEIHKLIEKGAKEGQKVHFIFGGTDIEVRENIRKVCAESTGNIIVASFGTTSTGINIPSLNNLIFAFSGKSRIRNLQSIGRALRRTDTKITATLYDIADDFTWKKKENFSLKHFAVRLKLYVSEKFDYKIYRIQLKDN